MSRCQAKKAYFCQKVIEDKSCCTLFSSEGIGLHQQVCTVMGFEPNIAFFLPSLFFPHCHFFFSFQRPHVRMAVICCFKTALTQSHSDIFITWLKTLYSTAHAPSSKKRDFGHLTDGWQAGSSLKGSNYQKTGQLVGASRAVIARGGPDLVRMMQSVNGWSYPKTTYSWYWTG